MFDYFSRFTEVAKLLSTTSTAVVERIKSWFARQGIPLQVITDNGPQFSSDTFGQFAKAWGFTHVTSSPLYPQGNGAAERAVRTAKQLLRKSPDPYLALLAYRSTPLAGGFSPSELLQGRRLRTTLPTHPSVHIPAWPDLAAFSKADLQAKSTQKAYFHTRHRAKTLPVLRTGDTVWVRDSNQKRTVRQTAHTPRSYYVQMQNGTVRRNRRDLNLTEPDDHPLLEPALPDPTQQPEAATPGEKPLVQCS
uniref:Integrase catalytic domain-containing protein n=1 Tax=Seriola dumerili TaxID=41447 RepID=A0A3B4TKL2_SERDU